MLLEEQKQIIKDEVRKLLKEKYPDLETKEFDRDVENLYNITVEALEETIEELGKE